MYLHRAVWMYYHGDIPEGYHVHHRDKNPANNDISNLVLLKNSEHMKVHMAERMQNPDYIKFLHDNFDKARIEASKWHGSEEGRKWHSEHAKNQNIQPKEFVCKYCGKLFLAKPNGLNRFCSNRCKSGYRLHSGVDNETRICVVCGKEFTTNKYYKIRTCSRECGVKLLSMETKGKVVKPLPPKQGYCADCGKPMMIAGYSNGKNLCEECKHKRNIVTSVCEICGKEFEHSKYNNARFCSPECVGKYNTQRKSKNWVNVDLEKLRNARIKKGLTLKQMAVFFNISETAYGSYERGKNPIRNDVLKKLCYILDVSESELIITKQDLGVY